MRSLLTGYAVSFNRKYRRHGQLFQNRYKSILCQEDPSTISKSVKRGAIIAIDNKFKLINDANVIKEKMSPKALLKSSKIKLISCKALRI
jgi:hypothetical protein